MAVGEILSKQAETILKEMYGKQLLQEYMHVLSSRDTFRTTFKCAKKGHTVTHPKWCFDINKFNHMLACCIYMVFWVWWITYGIYRQFSILFANEDCLTPFGMMMEDLNKYHPLQPRVLRAFGAGTSCVDVSSMGSQKGLLGDSCRSLSIWMSELLHCRPVTCICIYVFPFFKNHTGTWCKYMPWQESRNHDMGWGLGANEALVYHECTGRFLRSVFDHYLGHLYDVHGFNAPEVGIVCLYLYVCFFWESTMYCSCGGFSSILGGNQKSEEMVAIAELLRLAGQSTAPLYRANPEVSMFSER